MMTMSFGFMLRLGLIVVGASFSLFFVGVVHAQAPVCTTTSSQGDSNCNISPHQHDETKRCSLYLAESSVHSGRLSVFAGTDWSENSIISSNELLLSMIDSNKNEYSPWHDLVVWNTDLLRGATLENKFSHDLLMIGIGSLATCGGDALANIRLNGAHVVEDSLGVHRGTHPTAGSFSYRQNVQVLAKHDIRAGDELFIDCHNEISDETAGTNSKPAHSLDWLEEHGSCIDVLDIQPSTLSGVGHGAFLKKRIGQEQVILSTPLLHVDRSQLEILEQAYQDGNEPFWDSPSGITYTDKVVGRQLLQNYVYGHPDSNVMLLPLAPGVNFINHDSIRANAEMRWSLQFGRNEHLKGFTPMELFEMPYAEEGHLVMDLVALREIDLGEEIFINYGKEWETEWSRHVYEWSESKEEEYLSALQCRQEHQGQHIRTVDEQELDPYPENLRVACEFTFMEEDSTSAKLVAGSSVPSCLLHCDVLNRTIEENDIIYTTAVRSLGNSFESDFCALIRAENEGTVSNLPGSKVLIIDKEYTKDTSLSTAFRHEIGVPRGLYPNNWLKTVSDPHGDFIASPLESGMLAPIRWKDSAEVVSPWAFRVGIPASVRQVLLEYCDTLGITNILRHVTSHGNGLPAGDNRFLDIDGKSWYLQRPGAEWRSNLHWLSPGDHAAHEDYLEALGAAGFDKVLDGVGKYFGMEGLVAFHVTFIAVSHSTNGYLHHDVLDTGRKTFNVIIPLILANETGPELDLMEGSSYDDTLDQEAARVGRYRYEYEVASMMGDGAVHATSACDYRTTKEMRMAATVYIADVNESNADAILNEYTQAFPPDDKNLLLSWAGRHWKRSDLSVQLPKPNNDHVLERRKGQQQ